MRQFFKASGGKRAPFVSDKDFSYFNIKPGQEVQGQPPRVRVPNQHVIQSTGQQTSPVHGLQGDVMFGPPIIDISSQNQQDQLQGDENPQTPQPAGQTNITEPMQPLNVQVPGNVVQQGYVQVAPGKFSPVYFPTDNNSPNFVPITTYQNSQGNTYTKILPGAQSVAQPLHVYQRDTPSPAQSQPRQGMYAKHNPKQPRRPGEIRTLDVVPRNEPESIPSSISGSHRSVSDSIVRPRPSAFVNVGYQDEEEITSAPSPPITIPSTSDPADHRSSTPGENTIIRRQLIDAGLWRVTPDDKGYIDMSIADSAEYVHPRESGEVHRSPSPIIESHNPPLDPNQLIVAAEVTPEVQDVDYVNNKHVAPVYDTVYSPTVTDQKNIVNLQDDTSPKRDRIICTVNPMTEEQMQINASLQTINKEKGNTSENGSTGRYSSRDTVSQSQTFSFTDTEDVSQSDGNTYEDIQSNSVDTISPRSVTSEEEDQCTYL